MSGDHHAEALAAIDRALAHRPRKDGDDFAAATRALCALRDALIRSVRTQDAFDRAPLAMLNGLISVVLAGQFPEGAIPWDDIATGRDWLAGARLGAQAGSLTRTPPWTQRSPPR